jgi:hypothetical protein
MTSFEPEFVVTPEEVVIEPFPLKVKVPKFTVVVPVYEL